MTHGTDPTLLAAMATSRETRVAVGVLVIVVVVLLVIGSWSAGAAAATEARFTSIEKAIAEDRGERRSAELDVRDVLTRLTQVETTVGLVREDVRAVKLDTQAIRDAVAPLPRPKGGP
jgi:septal ring factor EnvC (AmiA/AmiB activator)